MGSKIFEITDGVVSVIAMGITWMAIAIVCSAWIMLSEICIWVGSKYRKASLKVAV